MSKFMTRLIRRNTDKIDRVLNLNHIKDVLIAHYQSIGNKELIDIDIHGLMKDVNVTFYVKKGGSSRTRKDE